MEQQTRDYTGGQFPSLDGDPDREVAQRQPHPAEPGFFRKIFTVHLRSHTPNLPADHPWHLQNAVEVVADAIRRGLHPKGEVELEGETPHPSDPNSVNIAYRVPVTPSIIDHDQTTTVTPSDVASLELVGEDEPEDTHASLVEPANEPVETENSAPAAETADLVEAPPVAAVPAAPLLH